MKSWPIIKSCRTLLLVCGLTLSPITVLDVHAAPKSPPLGHCNAQAEIINLQGLNFGEIVAVSSGNVSVDTNGFRSGSGGVVLVGGVVSEALFELTSQVGCAVYGHTILFPSSTTLSSGANTMMVDGFVHALITPALVDASGYGQVQVGATLHVGNNQPSGDYAGQFTMEIVFQ